MAQLNLRLDERLVRRFVATAAALGRSLRDAGAEALLAWSDEHADSLRAVAGVPKASDQLALGPPPPPNPVPVVPDVAASPVTAPLVEAGPTTAHSSVRSDEFLRDLGHAGFQNGIALSASAALCGAAVVSAEVE